MSSKDVVEFIIQSIRRVAPFILVWWLAYVTVHYFWGPFTKSAAGANEQLLNRTVDLADDKPAEFKTVTTEVTTDTMQVVFTTQGATVERLAFKRPTAQGHEFIDTIFPPAPQEERQRSFLVAFDQHTPYYYSLVDRAETADATMLTYRAAFNKGTITKTFTVHKQKYQIDLDLKIENNADSKIHPRILFSAPVLSSHKDEGLAGIVDGDNNHELRVIKKGEELLNSYWAQPAIFGTQNVYFVHALVSDKDDVLRRGYFTTDNEVLVTILECTPVTGTMQAHLAFYCGPKEEKALATVDARLVKTIDYGWFAPISRVMLKALNFLYHYVHNYGWAIILLTFIIRILLLPLTISGERSMKHGVELGRRMQALERKYKDNPEMYEQQRLQLLKQHGFGLGGCIAQLSQLPLLFALGSVLRSSIQLYKAPFMGWIQDLSMPDPYYILPLVLLVALITQSGKTKDMQQRIAMLVGALLFAGVSTGFPAGLTLYMVVGTLLGTVQSFIQNRLS